MCYRIFIFIIILNGKLNTFASGLPKQLSREMTITAFFHYADLSETMFLINLLFNGIFFFTTTWRYLKRVPGYEHLFGLKRIKQPEVSLYGFITICCATVPVFVHRSYSDRKSSQPFRNRHFNCFSAISGIERIILGLAIRVSAYW